MWSSRFDTKTLLNFETEPKNTTPLTNLLDHCYWFSMLLLLSGLKKIFLKRRPHNICRPALDAPQGGSGPNAFTHVRAHEHFIPSKFRKQLHFVSSGSLVNADYVFQNIYMHQCNPLLSPIYLRLKFLKADLSPWKPPPYFYSYLIYLCPPIFLDKCHAWFHLYGLRRAFIHRSEYNI